MTEVNASMFAELAKVLSVPDSPSHTRGDWAEVERRDGFVYPADFKRFVEVYGKGVIQPVGIWLSNPFRSTPRLELIRDQHLRLRSDVQRRFFPDSGGLFPWGGSDSNHYFFWSTTAGAASGDIVATLDCCEYATFPDESMVAFLLRLLEQVNSGAVDAIFESLLPGDDGDFEYQVVP